MKKDKLQNVLSKVNEKDFDVIVEELDKGYRIVIHKRIRRCALCKRGVHYKTLSVRQDSRVKFLMVGKKICRTCLPQVDLIVNNLKDSVKSPLITGRW